MFQWLWSLFFGRWRASAKDSEGAEISNPALTPVQYFILTTLRSYGEQRPGNEGEIADVLYQYDEKRHEVLCYSTSCGSPHYDGDGIVRVSIDSWEEFLRELRELFRLRIPSEHALYPDREYPRVYWHAMLPSHYDLPNTYRCCIERADPWPGMLEAIQRHGRSMDDDCDGHCCCCGPIG